MAIKTKVIKKNIVLKKSFEGFWDFHIIEKSWIQTNQNAPSECTSTNCGYDFFKPIFEAHFFSLFFQVVLVEKFIANLPTLSNWGEQVLGRASLDLPKKIMPLNATVFIF